MRANAKDFTIVSYAEYHQLDPSNVKVKEPNHLFDTDLTNRKSLRRTIADRDAAEATTTSNNVESKPRTIDQILEEKEKTSGVKKRKLFDYDDEW